MEEKEEITIKASKAKCIDFVETNFDQIKKMGDYIQYKHKEYPHFEAAITMDNLYFARPDGVVFYFKDNVVAIFSDRELDIWPQPNGLTETQKRAVIRTRKLLEKELKSENGLLGSREISWKDLEKELKI